MLSEAPTREQLDATLARLGSTQDQVTTLEASLSSSKEWAGILQTELNGAPTQDQLDTANAQLKAAQDELASIEAELAGAQERATRFGTMLSEAPTREQLDATLARLKAAQDGLADAEERATRFGTMLSEAPTREQLDATVARLGDVSNTANDLQTANGDLEQRLAALNDEIEATQADRAIQLGTMQSRMAELRLENRDLQNELDLLASQPPQVVQANTENSDALRNGLINALGSDAIINPDGSLSLSSSATFAAGSATLSGGGQQVLGRAAGEIVNFLNNRPDARGVIVVEGHTDADPINTRQFPSNWTLSAARSANVVNFLITSGVPANRIRAEAYSDTQPIDAGTSREAFARNRRIEFDFAPE